MFSHSLVKSLWLIMAALLIMAGEIIPFPLLVLFTSITFAAPLVREFRRHSDLDERQLQIGHYSSHIAYLTFLVLLGVVLINEWAIKYRRPDSIWFILLLLPIILKAIICLFQNYGSASGCRGFMALFFRGIVPQNILDERQNLIGNFSSHMAFYLYAVTVVCYVLFRFIARQEHPGNIWYMLLIVPILSKFYVSLLKNYGAGTGARMICLSLSGSILLFVLLSHGIGLETIIEAGPFLLLIAVVLLSFRFPRVCGLIFLASGIGSSFFFNWHNFEIYLRILMYSVIPLPLVLSGFALLTVKRLRRERN